MTRILVFLAALLVGTISTTYAGTPQQDVRDAEKFLEDVPHADRPFIKFFSISNLPTTEVIKLPVIKELEMKEISIRVATEKILNFTVHSLSSKKNIAHVKRVRASDLYWVDIRDYGWNEKSWNIVSKNDPYYREPWTVYGPPEYAHGYYVNQDYVVRADWFIAHLLDTTKQFDLDREPLYYVLLYSGEKVPKTIDEFRIFWGFGGEAQKEAVKFELTDGTNVDYGESGVARHNRQLARIRTNRGYYHETSDVKNNQKQRDYIENLQPGVIGRNDRDAGEAIASNALGLQVYFLIDGKGNRVEFADPTVAVDWLDRKDVRVRTGRSCIICHSEGLNPAIPAFREMLQRGNIELRTYDLDYKREIENFYLSELGILIKEDNEFYSRAVKKVNGLTSDINSYLFKKVVERYEQPLTIERVAEETGVTPEEFALRCSPTARGRLGDLLGLGKNKQSRPIPREVWDDFEGGAFYDAMVLIYNITPRPQVVTEQGKLVIKKPQLNKLRVVKDTILKLGEKELAEIKAGTAFEIINEKDGWFKVNYNGVIGYIYKDYVQLELGD